MDSATFLNHYLNNLSLEQKALHGLVPLYAPLPKPNLPANSTLPMGKIGFCAWGDSIVVLPWEIYLRTHDRQMLASVTHRTQLGGKSFLWEYEQP